MTTTAHAELEALDHYTFGWSDSDGAGASAPRPFRRGCPRHLGPPLQEGFQVETAEAKEAGCRSRRPSVSLCEVSKPLFLRL
jgi:hypothetical protein